MPLIRAMHKSYVSPQLPEKCCGKCVYASFGYEGDVTCEHRDTQGAITKFYSNPRDFDTKMTDAVDVWAVCDLFVDKHAVTCNDCVLYDYDCNADKVVVCSSFSVVWG